MNGRRASRPRRKCVQEKEDLRFIEQTFGCGPMSIPQINEEYLVGYVLDGETDEMIAKKFEVLEAMQMQKDKSREKEREIKDKQKGKELQTPEDLEEEEQPQFTREELKEMFRMTSNFTLTSAMAGNSEDDNFWVELIDETEAREHAAEGDFEYFDENDIWDDDDEDDYLYEGSRKRSRASGAGRPRGSGSGPSPMTGSGVEAAELPGNSMAKMVSCEVIGADGRMYRIKKRARIQNPTAPVYTRIPPDPMPLSWSKRVRRLPSSVDLENAKVGSSSISVRDICKMDLESYGPFQGILMDPHWHLPGEPKVPGSVSPDDFARLKITEKVIPKGIIFVWVEKEVIPSVVRTMEKWGFIYVENFVWVKKSVSNKILARDSEYFRKSKESLLIFRKVNNGSTVNRASYSKQDWHLELRHQRNPDVVFDFARPKRGILLPEKNSTNTTSTTSTTSDSTTTPATVQQHIHEEKPDFVYHVIETMLPESNYNEKTRRGMLLELWARPEHRRKGWVSVVQNT